ncbi:PREDICTED: uncharacterized protein KIAA0754-like [Prunus mume]|uniref:Uncharacterized protein KIAA0754-like n=1 Tax=Prunus mume TaxID=102107 RepID=A0ABM0PY64_PRUMU|nr:PREDICTED: uncharacterized protein KIAA0754-like [Prunus mume]
MTFLTLTPWLHRNAYDEDGRVWYEECISTRFIRPVEEAVRGALKNADWDPLLPKAGKRKKVSTVLSRPSTPAAAVPRVAAPPLARAAIVTSIAAPTSRAPAVVGARKTLAHRTVPSVPPARPIVTIAPGRKRGREASSIEVAPVESVAVETAVSERPRKRGKAVAEEEAAAEVAVEGAATAEAAEMLDFEAAVAEVPATEEAAADMPDDEVLAMEPSRAALVEVHSAASAVPILAVTASVEPLPSAPRRSSGIVIRLPPRSSLSLSTVAVSMPPAPLSQDSTVVTELAVVEAIATDAPSPPPISSTVLTELVGAEVLSAPSAAEETASSNDLEELYASLHEEGGSSASAPLD